MKCPKCGKGESQDGPCPYDEYMADDDRSNKTLKECDCCNKCRDECFWNT